MLVMSPLRTTKFLFWQITQYLLILAILILNLAQPSFSRYGTPIYPAVKDMAQVVYNTKGQWPNMTYMLSARVFSTSSAGLSSDPTLAPDISAFLPDVEDRISGTDQDPNTYPVTLYERALEEKQDEDRDSSYVHNGDLDAPRSSVDGSSNEDQSDMTLVREGSETEHQWKVVPHRLRGRNECTKSDMEQAELLNSDLEDKQLLDLPTTLYIGGLFESTDLQSRGRSEFHSAQMAIGHINEKGIIPGYKLDLVYNETACDPGIAMDALYNLIYCKPEMIMILGGACSEVTKTLGEIVPYWNLILFSYASISPALSKREVYKTFVSLAPADSSYNAARMLFIKHFKWDTVATIYEDTEMYSLAMADMAQTFEQNNISPKTAEAFDTDVAAKLENLKENDARIIIGGFSENAARKVICQAYKLKLFGKRHVWMLSGSFTKEWWKTKNDTSCTDDQLTEALQGYFTVASINALTGSMRMRSIGGLSTDDFIKEYYRNNGTSPISPHATNTYDAVWTIALTLKSVVEKGIKYGSSLSDYRLEHFEYETGSTMSQHFLKIIEELEFVGVSGPVSFNGPDRQGLAVIQQYQGGQMQVVALYEPDNESLNFSCDACVPVIWQGGRIPCDKNVIVMKLKAVDPTAFYTVCSLCILGVVLALFFLAFNLHNRSLKFIKLSSPILNNVAVIGCILVYLAVMLLGFDEKTMRQDHYPLVCTTRAFLFAAGFSLAFGSMFTKTYRVHQIFTRAHSGVIRSKLLRDKQLLFIIGALLVIDSSLITVWVVVDPMHQEKTNLSSQLSETGEDIIYISQLSRCQSTHLEKWMGVLYAYKGLMLVFGVYMAWETRNVKIPALNDSRYIGMNVYNVVIMSTIVVVLSNILSDQPTLSYAIQSTFIFLSTTGTLCLMFLPKIYAIMTSNGNPVITGTGITVQANIRRFDFSDKKELQYRAEIQNKVYKRELVALEEEISRLEMLLEIPAITYFRLTDELLSLMPEGEIDINVITASMRGGGLQSCPSISDADDMVSYFGESTDDSRQQMDDHGDEELGGISGKSPKKIGGLKKRPNSDQYAEYELTFDEITDGLFMDKTDSEKKKKKGGWEKINISKLTSKGSKARAFFSGRRSASLRSVVTPPQTPSLPATSTSSGETTTSTVNTISPQVSLLSQRLQFQLKQAAQLSKQRLQHQTQSLPSPKPGLQRSFTQPSPPLSPSSKMKTGDALTPQGDQPKTVRFTVDSFEAGGGSEELEEETTVRSRRFEKEKYPGKALDSLTLSASSSSLRIGSPSLLNLSASQSAMSISSIPVSPIANESTAPNLGTESTGSSNLSSMKFSLHKILTPKILRELKLQNLKELQQAKQEIASEKPSPAPTPSTEVLPPLPPPSSSTSTTDTTTTTTSASTTSDSSTTTITIASTTAPDDTEAVASTSSNTPSFTLASIIQLKRQQSSPTSSRSSAEIATTSEGTIGETMTPGDGGDAITPVPSIYVTGTAPKALPEEIVDSQESSASPSRQKPSTSSRGSFKSTSKTWAKAAARAAAKAASRAAARASAAAAAAASSVKSSSSSSLSSALSSSTSTSSTGLHLHLRSPELRTPNPQTPNPVRLASAGNEEGVAEEAAAQTPDPEQFDIPSAEGMEKVIDNERKIRIKRLQRDLTRIQKELQALDDLEYEVSYV